MARAGIYNLRIHLEQVLRPVLENHFRLAEIDGLTDVAKQAREEIFEYLDRLKRVAARLGEPLGPVKGDISSDPIGVARKPRVRARSVRSMNPWSSSCEGESGLI